MSSPDLKAWSKRTSYLSRGPAWADGDAGQSGAPGRPLQVADNKWVLFFQMQKKGCRNGVCSCIGAATSTHPGVPFDPLDKYVVCDPAWNYVVDASPRKIGSSLYLYWKRTGGGAVGPNGALPARPADELQAVPDDLPCALTLLTRPADGRPPLSGRHRDRFRSRESAELVSNVGGQERLGLRRGPCAADLWWQGAARDCSNSHRMIRFTHVPCSVLLRSLEVCLSSLAVQQSDPRVLSSAVLPACCLLLPPDCALPAADSPFLLRRRLDGRPVRHPVFCRLRGLCVSARPVQEDYNPRAVVRAQLWRRRRHRRPGLLPGLQQRGVDGVPRLEKGQGWLQPRRRAHRAVLPALRHGNVPRAEVRVDARCLFRAVMS